MALWNQMGTLNLSAHPPKNEQKQNAFVSMFACWKNCQIRCRRPTKWSDLSQPCLLWWNNSCCSFERDLDFMASVVRFQTEKKSQIFILKIRDSNKKETFVLSMKIPSGKKDRHNSNYRWPIRRPRRNETTLSFEIATTSEKEPLRAKEPDRHKPILFAHLRQTRPSKAFSSIKTSAGHKK